MNRPVQGMHSRRDGTHPAIRPSYEILQVAEIGQLNGLASLGMEYVELRCLDPGNLPDLPSLPEPKKGGAYGTGIQPANFPVCASIVLNILGTALALNGWDLSSVIAELVGTANLVG